MNLLTLKRALFGALLGAVALGSLPAAAQTLVNEQAPVPFGTAGAAGNSDLLTQSIAVTGGTLYITTLKQPGLTGQPVGLAQTFTPSSVGGRVRYLPLTDAKSDLGVPMTAAAGTPSGTVGVTRTAGTSLTLDGEATSGSAKTDKALWEFNLPDSYVAGANIPVIVNCNYTGGGTITAVSTTMTAAAYTETNGVEAALTVSAAQQMAATAGNLTFTITGTALTPGQHVAVELTMLVTSASGANTGHINSVAIQG